MTSKKRREITVGGQASVIPEAVKSCKKEHKTASEALMKAVGSMREACKKKTS